MEVPDPLPNRLVGSLEEPDSPARSQLPTRPDHSDPPDRAYRPSRWVMVLAGSLPTSVAVVVKSVDRDDLVAVRQMNLGEVEAEIERAGPDGAGRDAVCRVGSVQRADDWWATLPGAAQTSQETHGTCADAVGWRVDLHGQVTGW